jgi:transcriptional regulator with XRE-family HTH domain
MSDFLAEMIAKRTKRNSDFPALVEAALNRRELLRALAAERQAAGLTQTEVAAALGTSQSQVARLESGNADAKLSTISRLAAVLGKKIEFRITDAPAAAKSTRGGLQPGVDLDDSAALLDVMESS